MNNPSIDTKQKRKPRVDAFGAMVLIGFSALLGLNQALVKLVNEGFAPVFQSGLRSIFAFFPVLVFALLMRKRLSISDGTLGLGIVCGLLFSFEFCLLFTALDYTTVARVSVLFYTMPVWVAFAAHFLLPGERLTRTRLFGLGVAMSGVVVAFADGDWRSGEGLLLGDILAIGAALLWAATAIMLRATRLSQCSPEMQLLYQLAVSAIVLTAIAPFFGDIIRQVTPMVLWVFGFQVVVVVSIGFVVWFWALSVYPATDMASFSLLAPAFGVLAGWLIFDDPVSVSLLVALLLVSTGIFVVNRAAARSLND